MPMFKLILDSCTRLGHNNSTGIMKLSHEMQLAQSNHKKCGNGIKGTIKTCKRYSMLNKLTVQLIIKSKIEQTQTGTANH